MKPTDLSKRNLRRDCDALTKEATQINAKIKLVLEALNEIQFGSLQPEGQDMKS